MTTAKALVLAGGGHSHVLLLKRWIMNPKLRPKKRIVLVNRSGSTLYTGMIPAVIAGICTKEAATIDLRHLCSKAGVAFVQAEICGLDLRLQQLKLNNRPAVAYDLLSLNVGAVTRRGEINGVGIKPLEPALRYLATQDPNSKHPFRVLGAGAAGIEVVMALRRRWPRRALQLQSRPEQLKRLERQALESAQIELLESETNTTAGSWLLCTGSEAPDWLSDSGLPVNSDGRVYTTETLQAEHHENVFATGDCAVIRGNPRPSSGVWAVRAAVPLARNLEARCQNKPLHPWRPQRQALQLIGNQRGQAWARRGVWAIGPHQLLWQLKRWIDQRFITKFSSNGKMRNETPMACRGCAAKLPAQTLETALRQVGLGGAPEDAVSIEGNPPLLQSVDGFPALLSDPWLNGRLTTLHACSDLWACGANVESAQAIVSLPAIQAGDQQELLVQTLGGVRSVLEEQGASLIGGHTMESRSETEKPAELGLQLTLCVNGRSPQPWSKGGIRIGDVLLLSRPLGTGVLFAAAMTGAARPEVIDEVQEIMTSSQHHLVQQLRPHQGQIHACTDITGFGLLGHLGEMLGDDPQVLIQLFANAIPAYDQALELFEQGYASSLAPANRRSWHWLDSSVQLTSPHSKGLLELLVDPQTCGPLLICCPRYTAEALIKEGPWQQIGIAKTSIN